MRLSGSEATTAATGISDGSDGEVVSLTTGMVEIDISSSKRLSGNKAFIREDLMSYAGQG